MNGEVIYFCLMLLGWFFLVGWTVALVTACAVVFREGTGDERLEHYGGTRAFKKAGSALSS
jgi:hypothetical protein